MVRILRGDEQGHAREHPLNPRACGQASFGALAFRSDAALDRMLDSLEHGGFLGTRSLDHGGVVLDLTPRGKAALQNPAALDGLLPKPKRSPKSSRIHKPSGKKAGKSSGKKDAEGMEIDEALLQALRAWRRKQAQTRQVPPYVVFHDSHLSAIAAHRPATLEALSELKGIGPHKLEQYGAEVIGLVREYREKK